MPVNLSKKKTERFSESGSALVVALFVMALLLGFAALVLSRTVTENVISMNDTAESRTFNVAEAALEDATRDFATIVEQKLNPTAADITTLQGKKVPYFSDNGYTIEKKIEQIGVAKVVTQTKGQFQGLISLRDEWQIDITATDKATNVVTQVRRRFFNDRIPIFQFGAFYQDDLEVQDPPLFIFNGRIHTNGNFFTNSGGSDIRYKSKITVAGEIIRDRWKSGAPLTSSEQGNNVYAPNATNTDVQLPTNRGSVTCSAGTGGILKDITQRNFPYPKCVANSNWTAYATNFEGNVVNKAKLLTLPVSRINQPLIEMIRRPKNIKDKANFGGTVKEITAATDEDDGTLSRERYSNKEGLRITLADSKDKLPQCAGVTGDCGVQLDSSAGFANSLGYQPLTMPGSGGYKTTALNGNRFAVDGRQVWIKVELVDFDYDLQRPKTTDVTQDILSLGVTEPVITSATGANLTVQGYTAATDSRSIIKLQRFTIPGNKISTVSTYLSTFDISSKPYNLVARFKDVDTGTITNPTAQCPHATKCKANNVFAPAAVNNGLGGVKGTTTTDERDHYKVATINDGSAKNFVIVPFPIQLFDTREGNRANSTVGTLPGSVYANGVMSLVDIDVANLRRFLEGEFDGQFPTTTPFAAGNGNVGLKSTNVPQNRGWVVYFSDRRGDANFDGRYNMEDVNPNYDEEIDEDVNGDGVIDKANGSTNQEAPGTDAQGDASFMAVTDHQFYRRGARLINAGTLPGKYNTAAPTSTKGFTFASENGVYTWKNFNVTGVAVCGGTCSTTSDRYSPLDTDLHIPASIVGDAVTVLSNNWNDGQSFSDPYDLTKRKATDTVVRFAMLAGDPITGYSPTEGINGSQNGGLINFKRFLESWSDDRLNYSGSLINLFNAFNSNGRHKPNGTVYNPPTRDWTFEESFKDPNRLPPGTPFVYFLTFTGFERVND